MPEDRHAGAIASARRLRLLAGHTLGEALRMRLALLTGAAAVLLLLAARWLREFNFGMAELPMLGEFGLGAMGLLGTGLAALATAHLYFNDFAGGAAACVLTRPVRRWEYVAGKYTGIAALLALFTVALGALLAGLLAWRSHQLGVPPAAWPVLLSACALQWMKFTLVAAMTLLVCTYAGTALFASVAGLMLAVIGHLRAITAGGMLDWLRVWPNLGLFDAEALLSSGQPLAGAALFALIGYWATCLALLVGLASYVFKHREF